MYIGYIRGVKYSILQVLYKAFYEYSIGHSTEYSMGYSIKYIYIRYSAWYFIKHSCIHFCIQLGRYKVYEGAQGYEVEG